MLTQADQKLKPVREIKKVVPRVCATCKFGEIDNGAFFCHRDNGYCCDAGDMTHWFRVCDRYKEQEVTA